MRSYRGCLCGHLTVRQELTTGGPWLGNGWCHGLPVIKPLRTNQVKMSTEFKFLVFFLESSVGISQSTDNYQWNNYQKYVKQSLENTGTGIDYSKRIHSYPFITTKHEESNPRQHKNKVLKLSKNDKPIISGRWYIHVDTKNMFFLHSFRKKFSSCCYKL